MENGPCVKYIIAQSCLCWFGETNRRHAATINQIALICLPRRL